MNPLRQASMYSLAGGGKGVREYLIYPQDHRIHACDFDLETEAHMILGRSTVHDPVPAFLKRHYIIAKVTNDGSTLISYAKSYSVHWCINRATLQSMHHSYESALSFMRLCDFSAKDKMLPWYCKLYNFEPNARRPIIHLHGYGARQLRMDLFPFSSHGYDG
jgi:hypothetical protein